ncbi:unnamed protein product, partial [Allacma fusca]
LPHVCQGSSDEIEEWKSKYFKTKEKLQNLRKKYKEVKDAHTQCNRDDLYE